MKVERSFIIKGDIIYSETEDKIVTCRDSFLICLDGKTEGIYNELPVEFDMLPIHDYTGYLIIPGMTDLHLHAPQHSFRGLNMHLKLIDWLDEVAFPEEAKFDDLSYAKASYECFARDLRKSATTRACVFATLHKDATILLMDIMEETGLQCMIGKVNMDRNSPSYLSETTKGSVEDTILWVESTAGKYQNCRPMLTPRFIPSCSDELMTELGRIGRKYKLPLQSHLSENTSEIEWVKELCPDALSYAEAYYRTGTFGGDVPTVMAHCVHLTEEEIELIRKQKVYVAHCPSSNNNIMSGIAPVKHYLDKGLKIGLGSDIAGGDSMSMFRVIVETIKSSKIYAELVDNSLTPLTSKEAFFLATKGGGSFFGKVGSFEKGYDFDALVIKDDIWKNPRGFSMDERLERALYSAEDRDIIAKYCEGKQLF